MKINTSILPKVFSVLLAGCTAAGMIHVYAGGKAAASSLTAAEKTNLSRTIDPNAEDINDNYMLSSTVLRGTICSADGKVIWGPYADDVGAEWSNLLGTGSRVDFGSAYASELRDVDYSFFSGFYLRDGEVDLTIPDSVQSTVYQYMTDYNVRGSACVYDYSTGNIECLVSTTSSEYLNSCFDRVEPGSTMKLVTMLLMIDQGIDPESIEYTCDGDYVLSSGGSIVCNGTNGLIAHGTVNGAGALGESCNCWFAYVIDNYLNLDLAAEELKELGFNVAAESDSPVYDDTLYHPLGKLHLPASRLQLGTTPTQHTVWDLVGLEHNLSSPVQMMEYTAMLASGGSAVIPRVEQSDEQYQSAFAVSHQASLQEVFRIWTDGYTAAKDGHYSACSGLITAAKTGTVTVDGNRHRLLAFCSQELNIAGYIYIENYDEAGSDLGELASFIAETVAAQ